jgi:aspartate aminotransferase-like enzyme
MNGHWSKVFTDMMGAHGREPVVLEEQWGVPLDPDKVRRQLDAIQEDNVKALFVTHVETSTGVLNPVVELSEVARERGLYYVVDAAQTLGGVEVCTDEWGVDFCISGNHKCMSAPAGLSYVAVSERGWKALEQRKTPIQGWYTSLLVWRDIWLRRQSGYFTFPVTLVLGLRAALEQMFDISLPKLYRRYALVAKAIRKAVMEMGLELVVNCDDCPGCDSSGLHCANTATAILLPDGVRHEEFARLMHEEYNLSIAGTYGPFAGKAFRVGPTGLMQIQPEFNMNLLSCMGMALQRLGFPAKVDPALHVADAILREI